MPFDLDTLLGSDPSGLLTPQERGGVTGQGLMSMGAAMLQAAAPSPYKHTTLSGLGAGIQGLVSGRQQATDQMLKQQLVQANTFDKLLPLYKMAQQYQVEGVPLPPGMRAVMNALEQRLGRFGQGAAIGQPGIPGQPVPGAGVPGAVSPSSGAPAAANPNDLYRQAAKETGVPPFGTMQGMPGAEVRQKMLEEHIRAKDPAISESELNKKVMEERVARHAKAYPAIIEMGHQGQAMKENADLSVSLMQNPNFYSGVGAPLVEAWKQISGKLGGDPNAANPMQVFGKITAANVNEQIGAMRSAAAEMGGAAGRIFQLQADLMQRASQSLANTPGSNLVLANMQKRAADNMIAIRDMAIQHTKENKILGPEFDQEMSDYIAKHPVLTRAELNNIAKTGTVEGAPAAAAAAPTSAPAGPPSIPGTGAAPVPGAIGPLGGGTSAPKPGTYNWTPNGMVPVQ